MDVTTGKGSKGANSKNEIMNSIENVSFGSQLLGWCVIENGKTVVSDGMCKSDAENKSKELSITNPANTYFTYLIQ